MRNREIGIKQDDTLMEVYKNYRHGTLDLGLDDGEVTMEISLSIEDVLRLKSVLDSYLGVE